MTLSSSCDVPLDELPPGVVFYAAPVTKSGVVGGGRVDKGVGKGSRGVDERGEGETKGAQEGLKGVMSDICVSEKKASPSNGANMALTAASGMGMNAVKAISGMKGKKKRMGSRRRSSGGSSGDSSGGNSGGTSGRSSGGSSSNSSANSSANSSSNSNSNNRNNISNNISNNSSTPVLYPR